MYTFAETVMITLHAEVEILVSHQLEAVLQNLDPDSVLYLLLAWLRTFRARHETLGPVTSASHEDFTFHTNIFC